MSGKAARLPQPTVQTKSFALQGGLDLVTAAPLTPPGHALAMLNYEANLDGYRRSDGLERFDGRPRPSQASYWVLNFDAGSAAITEGQTVTGGTSAATGVALLNAVIETGAYSGGTSENGRRAVVASYTFGVVLPVPDGTIGYSDRGIVSRLYLSEEVGNADGYLVLTNVSGTFQDNENLQVSAATKSVANGLAIERGALNDTDDTTWIRDAIETARALITTVTGSGRILGVWFYNGNGYCFRNNAGGTAAVMYKSSTSGWAAVTLPRQVAFTSGGGAYTVAIGDTITGATSAATATVKRVNITSGTFAGGDAVGWLIITPQVGTFQAENLNVGANLNVATIAGNSAQITLLPDGRYEFRNFNFYGASNRYRMYGCDGVNPAFEFDGTTYVPIHTGMVVDAPDHIAVFRNYLFLSFPGGSVQNSAVGEPLVWTAILGAAEIGIGQDVTGMLESILGTLSIFARNKIAVLSGTSTADFRLDPFAEDAGAVEWTAQIIVNPTYLDDGGIRDLKATQAFGDFKIGTHTRLIDPLLKSKKKAVVTAVSSVRSRNKTSYRLFFSDETGISIFLGGKQPQIGAFNLGLVVRCACQSEETNGDEIILIGSDDGYVYQLDAGNSLDGTAMEFFVRLAFCHADSPQVNKNWKDIILDVDSPSAVDLEISAEYDYGDQNQTPTEAQEFILRGGGGFWDEMTWDEFYWDNPVKGSATADLDGLGVNCSIAIAGTTIYDDAHTLQTARFKYTGRGLAR